MLPIQSVDGSKSGPNANISTSTPSSMSGNSTVLGSISLTLHIQSAWQCLRISHLGELVNLLNTSSHQDSILMGVDYLFELWVLARCSP
jgi:hypothetical protein